MVLFIDSTNREQLIVRLLSDGEIFAEKIETRSKNHAQHLLPMIEQILEEQGKSLQDIDSVEVNPGPGSFTGTRVGVAVANALAFALNIPVNGNTAGQVQPVYDRAPNISTPKARS